MEWRISADSPIYAQLARQMRLEIASGARAPGEKLPPVRELALFGARPELSGVRPRAAGLEAADREDLPLLVALWETGRLEGRGLEFT